MSVSRASRSPVSVRPEASIRPLLTVVVPVYNGGEEIVESVEIIRRAVASGLVGEDVELVVVSDGSIDGTAERLLDARSDENIRVIHYDRNLGKGYAVKAGALIARGDWIAIVDADLDLDPASIPAYLEIARRDDLDFAIGSKRHPESVVHYPRSRRIASWGYQQLNRMLFRLDVHDTQVGLKVFRREVAERVLPLLLVKRFAFDLELLAVARALGYDRVRELPVRLEYRFTGSEVRSSAVARALWDTAAVFYRLRILRTYQRKRHLLRTSSPPADELPLVTLIGNRSAVHALEYERLEVAPPRDPVEAAQGARGELLAVLARGTRPAWNWVGATVPYIERGDAAAVVVPTLAPASSSLAEQAAAAILESRLGGGSRRFRYFPGNVRIVSDYPAESCVIRRHDYLAARAAGIDAEHLVSWLAERGRRTVYTPDASIAASPPPLLRPHLRGTIRHARARGAAARRSHGRSVSGATLLSLLPATAAVVGLVLIVLGTGSVQRVGLALLVAFGSVVVGSAAIAALRFRSPVIGLLAAPGLVATQAVYVGSFLTGFARGR